MSPETLLGHHGERLLVPERVIVAPAVGIFQPVTLESDEIATGQSVGTVDGPGTSTPVASPFDGRIVGMLAHPGERVREGQPVAWLRVQ